MTYRSRYEIRACLSSIPRVLFGRAVQVLVVDNASNDGIEADVRSAFPWVEFIQSGTNLGFGRANNLAYERAHGDFILFLNPDTVSNEAAYLHCLQRLRAEPDIGVISPRLVLLNGEMDLACRRSIPSSWDGFCRAVGLAKRFPKTRLFAGYNLTYLPDEGTYDVGAVNGAFMLCRHRVLLRVGVFDEQFFMYSDDLDLCYRMRQAGYRVVYDGRVQITHVKGVSSSKEVDKMVAALFGAAMQFYLKHFNPHKSKWVILKYSLFLRAWKWVAALKARASGFRRVRPL